MKKFYGTCDVTPIEEQIKNLPPGTYFTWNKWNYCLLRHTQGGALCSKIGFPVPLFFAGSMWVLPSQSQIELTLF